MGNIVLLDDLTINKIAAGEVIERPSSVVKELVENSIDAGAKNITVEIKNGGISMIKISDDGCGISEDDMEIAFERHATSKIRSADDLLDVTTMGFRGEALASVAAIAKVEMISRKENEVAHKIVVEGGKTLEFTEAARSTGTTITVSDLFYNTPVRYKFLKKDYTEAGYIEDVITRLALVNINIAFKLISNGKTIIQTNGNSDMKSVIYSIYGKDVAAEIIEVDYQYEDVKITGVVGRPVIARANRTNQMFFLNGRYIKDKNMTAAADQAYKGIIPVGRFGFVILNIEVDPKEVDVNVHPAKLEVRFSDEGKIFKAVYHTIKSKLEQSEIPALNRKIDSQQTSIVDGFNDAGDYSHEKKHGLKSIFKKKNKDEDDEEENNVLADIFNSRKNAEKLSQNTEETPVIEEDKKDSYSFDATKIISSVYEAEGSSLDKKEKVEEKYVQEDTIFDDDKVSDDVSTDVFKVREKKDGIKDTYLEELKRKFNEKLKNSPDIAKEVKAMNLEMKKEVGESYVADEKESYDEKENIVEEKPVEGTVVEDIQDINNTVNEVEEVQNVKAAETVIDDDIKDDILNNIYKVNLNVDDVETINDENVDKQISYGNTIISSDTKEIDVSTVETLIKDATQEMISTKLANKEATQVINIPDNINEDVSMDKTQRINIHDNKDDLSQETIVTDKEGLNKLPQDTMVVDADGKTIVQEEDFSGNEYTQAAEQLVNKKLSIDNTQMVDTGKIRDAIKEGKSTELDTETPEFEEMYRKTFGIDTYSVRKEKELKKLEKEKLNVTNDFSYVNENMNIFKDDEEKKIIPYKYVGNAFDKYMILEIKDEMYIIDQHSANERIMYETIRQNYYDEATRDEQFLLLPDVITLNKKQMTLAHENLKLLTKAGFSFEEFGDMTIKLTSVPGITEDLNTKQLFTQILDSLETVAITDQRAKEERFLSIIAENIADKILEKTSEDEIRELLDKLLSIENPFNYVQGKTIAIKMSRNDLERKFSRR